MPNATILIPAAGYGRRVGAPPAKELLPHPQTGRPLIENALNVAARLRVPACVISRKDKLELNQYVKNSTSAELHLIDASEEWPETLINAKQKWRDRNLVLLPDTEFAPVEVAQDILDYCTDTISFATFPVDDCASWGVLTTTTEGNWIAEKPITCLEQSTKPVAWGLFAFSYQCGSPLLLDLLESSKDHSWKLLKAKPYLAPLSEFRDLTRKS